MRPSGRGGEAGAGPRRAHGSGSGLRARFRVRRCCFWRRASSLSAHRTHAPQGRPRADLPARRDQAHQGEGAGGRRIAPALHVGGALLQCVLPPACASSRSCAPPHLHPFQVHNFMTYSGTVLITPGPRLNLVLGPNGEARAARSQAAAARRMQPPRAPCCLPSPLTPPAAAPCSLPQAPASRRWCAPSASASAAAPRCGAARCAAARARTHGAWQPGWQLAAAPCSRRVARAQQLVPLNSPPPHPCPCCAPPPAAGPRRQPEGLCPARLHRGVDRGHAERRPRRARHGHSPRHQADAARRRHGWLLQQVARQRCGAAAARRGRRAGGSRQQPRGSAAAGDVAAGASTQLAPGCRRP